MRYPYFGNPVRLSGAIRVLWGLWGFRVQDSVKVATLDCRVVRFRFRASRGSGQGR